MKLQRLGLLALLATFILNLLTSPMLYPIWEGRVKSTGDEKLLWIYGENKKTRKIAFLELENFTKERRKDYKTFSRSIPKAIAKKLEKIKKIEVPSYDYIPIFPTREKAYKIVKIPFSEATTNKEQKEKMEEIFKYGKIISKKKFYPEEEAFVFAATVDVPDWAIPETNTNTASTNTEGNIKTTNLFSIPLSATDLIEKEIETEREKREQADKILQKVSGATLEEASNKIELEKNKKNDPLATFTNYGAAYIVTNHETKELWLYQYKQDEITYIDAETVPELAHIDFEQGSELTYIDSVEEPITNFEVPIRRDVNGLKYFYVNDEEEKKLEIDSKLYALNRSSWEDLLKLTDADYLIYGSYEVVKNKMTLKLYAIHVLEKYIVHFLTKTFFHHQVIQEIEFLDIDILSYFQKKPIVQNINFKTDTPGGLLYLDDAYYGKLPRQIKRLVKGEYQFKVPLTGQINIGVASVLPVTSNTINFNQSDQQVEFFYEDIASQGKLKVTIKNEIPGDIYVNNELMVKEKLNYTDEFTTGEYFVSVQRSNFVKRNFMVPVEKNRLTEVQLDMQEIKPKTWVDRAFFNHARNTRAFAVVGLSLIGGFIGTYAEGIEYEDKKDEVESRLEGMAKGEDKDTLEAYRQKMVDNEDFYKTIGYSLLGGGVLFFGLMTWSHFMDIWSYRAPIETELHYSGDVKFVFKKEF